MNEIQQITPDTDYTEVKECDYKGEHYSVRDNGAIFRHARDGKPKRKHDEFWTFGKPNDNKGYMEIAGQVVHRIVAYAFLGNPPTDQHVVDHIDTNRRNNRPENLRWLTRLDNALLNPITRKKIEFLCGSIDNFINNPSCLRDTTGTNQDIAWMRTVSKEEAKASFERIKNWVSKPNNEISKGNGQLGEWIFKQTQKADSTHTDSYRNNIPSSAEFTITSKNGETHSFILRDSQTPNALQGNWYTPTEFVCCPSNISNTPLVDYFNNLKINSLFSRNSYGDSFVLDFALSDDKEHLWVLTKNPDKEVVKPWALAEVILHNDCFLHLNRHSFFEEIGGRKYFTLEQGKEWTGGDCLDDVC